jgi:hypothetical protein
MITQEAEWASEPVWTLWEKKKSVLPMPGIKPCFLDCAAHILVMMAATLTHGVEMACNVSKFIISFVKRIQKLKPTNKQTNNEMSK